jgi:hypothetical protein
MRGHLVDPSFWDVIKRDFPAEQLLPSLNSVDLLNREQLKVYHLIVNHYSDYLAGRNPPQLRVNLDGVAVTGKTYVLLQASKWRICYHCRKDPVLRAAPTGIAAHNFHGRTLHSLFQDSCQNPPTGALSETLKKEILKQPFGIVFQMCDANQAKWLRKEEYANNMTKIIRADTLEELARILSKKGLKDPL